ncbi:MAG: HAMP domain-containing histidine kinase [Phycisphaeraceae bacterium]|nr:HAMP domain-containing histidine kinase [Phycisphaeraceae bacterium]
MDHLDAAARGLDDLRSELEVQERLARLGTITGLVAHELAGILTPVLPSIQAALASGDGAASRRALERSEVAAIRSIAITRLILGFAGNEFSRGADDAQARGVDPAQIVTEVVRELRVDGELGSTDIHVRVLPGLQVDTSAAGLQHLVLNLVRNAVEAVRGSKKGSVGIVCEEVATGYGVPKDAIVPAECSTWNPSAAPAWTSLVVTDDGPGLTRHQVERVFHPLVTSSRRGTGLGLTFCTWLVRDSGGLIYMQSKHGAGTRVTVLLPTSAPEAARQAA